MDRILYKKDTPSKSTLNNNINPYSTNTPDTKNLGVLVIDPNKVVNEYNEIVDRYVKQEDLVMYANLKVYKGIQSAVVQTPNGEIKQAERSSPPILINFLNPLSNKKNSSGFYTSKNKQTNEWTDFFTSNASNDIDNENYILDPETFGITSISIRLNASLLPIITIEFTDVQGRVLFERGNDKDSPYNIFFTYPYPKFMLTYKGYYGKATESQLVLKSSNTKFDPSSGNYNIVAEFQSDVFSIFNSFLIVYAYVAPYMFDLGDGETLGSKILKELYNRQNIKIKEAVGDELYRKYAINGNPTLQDLGAAITNIALDSKNEGDLTITQNNNILLNNKKLIDGYFTNIKNFLNDNQNAYGKNIVEGVVTYQPLSNDYRLNDTNREPTLIYDYINRINESIKIISQINVSATKNNNFSNELLKNVSTNKNLKTYISKNRITTIDNLLQPNILKYEDTNDLFLDNLVIIVDLINESLTQLQVDLEDEYLDEQIADIGSKLNYEPNFNNILRIISNNMQTFLILLEIVGSGALKQIQTDKNRVGTHLKSTTYDKRLNNSYITPFPSYFKVTKERDIYGDLIDKNVLDYPGSNVLNQNWFEVQFIEEIYNSISKVKKLLGGDETLKKQTPTNILSLFQLGENDLNTHQSKDHIKMFGEMFTKFSLYSNYSGIYNRSNPTLYTDVIPTLARFDLKIITNKILSDSNNFTLINELKLATKTDNTDAQYTNIGNFGIKYIGFADRSLATSINKLKPILNEYARVSVSYQNENNYINFITKYTDFINSNVSNKSLYNLISFSKFSDIDTYSINAPIKTEKLKNIIDLKYNDTYYTDNGDMLSDLSNNLLKTDTTNIYNGLYQNMNQELSKIKISTDINRNVTYSLKTVPALTFNTLMSDFEDSNDSIFNKIIKDQGNNYQSVYNI